MIFAVISDEPMSENIALGRKIDTFKGPTYKIREGAWLVSAKASAREVATHLGFNDEATGLVVEVGSYHGRSNPDVWTWIKANWEGVPLG